MSVTFSKGHDLQQRADKITRSRSADKSGLPPGSLIHIGEKHAAERSISVIQYSTDKLIRHDIRAIGELRQLQNKALITWVNVDGLNDTSVIEEIGQELNIHPLVLEDILSTHQRPKLEEYEDYLYLVAKGISLDRQQHFHLQYEQISILLLANYVVTFKEKADDTFKPIYAHLQNGKARLRQFGSDYLAYVILDTIVDEYFVVEDSLDEIIDSLEDDLLLDANTRILRDIQQLRRELITMKRSISPLRDLLAIIQRTDTVLLQEKTLRYYGDVYDHVLRVTDSLDSYRERIAALQDIYLSSISNKMNETMKILTIFASIFIPLTFITGIYGMNFEYMPELKWRWSYPLLWVLFICISIALLIVFKRKKWL
ncbi:magnesium transporter [Nitrosomonas cryotolerans]|uniref:Magnesium transport protein CorA n=1 Tax=Nitrosomonas cryotolerans ATCC 49181 TaxID=1131553 RepID=A0A1N6GVK4_9PROT|nr:magnesium/cobalt transporter CorA [Nitrosomonas cryotolerans]SFP41407.1 magnesium transporter [Nitrosomonas cryotolerans]SIO11487.1 magnesium transporter [Nitrosomonas cryotolerans ATCC 49181]